MKNFFLSVLLLLLAQLSFAQAKNIKISNTSSCPVYISLRLSEPTIDPCSPVYESTVFALAPLSSQVFDYSNYPGSTATAPQYFVYVKIFEGPTACSGNAIAVGEPCYVFPQSAAIQLRDNSCAICDDVNAYWYPTSNPNSYAGFEIRP